MTPSRWRLVGLATLALPLALQAAASGASPAFGALALAGAAAALSLLLAGPILRSILAALIGLLGGAVVLVAVSIAAPGAEHLVPVGGVGGALQFVAGAFVAVTARRWPLATSRYTRTRMTGDRASEWDSLTSGDDPTALDEFERQ